MSPERPTEPIQRGWLWSCGCGTDWIIRNAVLTRHGDNPCAVCLEADLTIDAEGRPLEGLVAAEMDWCACGSPWDIDRWMVTYLTEAQSPWTYTLPEQTWTLLAYIADGLGWTEHGGSIRCAWLTDDGREALANLQAALARPAPTGDDS